MISTRFASIGCILAVVLSANFIFADAAVAGKGKSANTSEQTAETGSGDKATKTKGTGIRPLGRVDDPITLPVFNPEHPYYMAEYDLADRG